jgi:mannose-6-phosphate isomerase-like protein (cupin superfamily)
MLDRISRIDHIGVIVDDLDEAIVFLRDVLGLQEGDHVDRADLRTVFFACGSTDIEAIEILDPEQRALRLGEGTAARIEHIAIEVSDLDRTYEALEQLGVEPKGPPQQAERYRAFWTTPASADGVGYQFVQRAGEVQVLRADDVETIDRGGGVSTVHLSTPERGAQSFTNGITAIEPGAAVPLHFHNCEESVLILEGTAVFDFEGESLPMHEGEITLVPAGVPHRFVNPGPGLLRIFFTYGSTSANRTMVDSGETAPIGSARDRLGL